MRTYKQVGFSSFPDPREDLESRSPNLGPYTTKGTLEEPPLRDLLFGSSRGSGLRLLIPTQLPKRAGRELGNPGPSESCEAESLG